MPSHQEKRWVCELDPCPTGTGWNRRNTAVPPQYHPKPQDLVASKIRRNVSV